MRYITRVAAPLWFGADAPAPASSPGVDPWGDAPVSVDVHAQPGSPGSLDHPGTANVTVKPGSAVEVQRNEDGSYTLQLRRPSERTEAYAVGAALGAAGMLLLNALRGKR